ncbi:PTS transporter subunit EIIB [Serratia odorifera]|uniref:Phosphotransferase system, EIIB n=2 Tax=Serratia odorifera TaxID=618 RepID=D4E814_SEROD|nr:PTS transporter subunit EIIB [Serratia odorifera]EFE94219.1 phosphotransferase system, EIIB [Serratia odorifera DSM 4582]PNK88933.1 PTS sugar transporter [Serratia odorifera]RII70038.1 PTS sugar transporter [Serratia odorifera]VDZ64571.1 EIICB-Glc [Serratia odorifera]
MVSLKAFIHYFSHPPKPAAVNNVDDDYLASLMRCLGGRDNIVHVDACITRLRVKLRQLSALDSEGLQQAGALGVIIIGQEVHAIFGKQSDNLRQLLEQRFAVKHAD